MSLVRLFIVVTVILLIIPFCFLGYGIWSVNNSKKVSNSTKSKIFLSTGIISIIIGAFILLIELFIAILVFILMNEKLFKI